MIEEREMSGENAVRHRSRTLPAGRASSGADPHLQASITPAAEKTAARQAARPPRRPQRKPSRKTLSPFSITVGRVYDGPLDLLLDLIRKQDIDIYDIPIAKITAQFLGYVEQLKQTDVDAAGDFIYMASLLIHIKSHMLLPRTSGGGGRGSRKIRGASWWSGCWSTSASRMRRRCWRRSSRSKKLPGPIRRCGISADDEGTEPEIAADTVDLVRVFREILERARNAAGAGCR